MGFYCKFIANFIEKFYCKIFMPTLSPDGTNFQRGNANILEERKPKGP